MARVTIHHLLDQATLQTLRRPRDDWMVAEVAEGDGFVCCDGPFTHWHRTIDVNPSATEAVETIDFNAATPFFRLPVNALFRHALRRSRRDRAPFWAPPQRFDEAGARSFALLVLATIAAAYLGSLLSQTITFVADEFGKDRTTQGLVTGLTRGGALIALVVVWIADRFGRRRTLLVAGASSAVLAAVAAVSPNIWFFGTVQTLSRGFATGFAILIGIFAAEESPAGSRAWATAVLALFAGLGAGMVLWLLPIADLDLRAWRILFVVALAALPVLWFLAPRLSESRRFEAHSLRQSEPAPVTRSMRKRFAMLATVGFAIAMFAAPASNFQNEFLRDERGFSAARITLYSTVVSTPVGIGVAVAGPLADRRGRRLIGIIGVLGGVIFTVVRYGSAGSLMWIGGVAGTIVGAATIPALGVYGPELFPTSRRGLANGLLTIFSVVGSVIGLYFVGRMSEQWSFGSTFAVLAAVPLLATLVIAHYPETARQALEDLNPADRSPGDQPPIV